MSEKTNLGYVTAYGIAKKNGFVGTEQEWLDSLHDYGNLVNAPVQMVTRSYSAEDATDTGLFMGQVYKKVSEDYISAGNLFGVDVDGTVYGDGNVIDMSALMLGIIGSEVKCAVVSPSGVIDNMDFVVISADKEMNVADFGIVMTKGTYVYETVSQMTLMPTAEISADFAGSVLPPVNELDDGQTLGVIGGDWVLAGKQNIGGVQDWNRIQRMMRGDYNFVNFPIWSQVRVPHKKYGEIVFDVVAHDIDKDPDNADRHTMTLYMRDCISGFQYDATEALCVCTNGLAAGSYHCVSGDSGKSWTLTKDVPAGGVLVFGLNLMEGEVTTISSYASITDENAIETVELVDGTEGTEISSAVGEANMNNLERAMYGSNNWNQSAIRQWLNSDGNDWWESKTKFDRPPSYAGEAGFLAGFPADFLSALVTTEQTTNTNTVYETDMDVSTSAAPVTYTTADKMFLASWSQLNGGQWSPQVAENTVWTAFADTPTGSSDDRVKYDQQSKTSTFWYWMRSCNPNTSYYARSVDTDGDPNDLERACDPMYGVAAACVIGEI